LRNAAIASYEDCDPSTVSGENLELKFSGLEGFKTNLGHVNAQLSKFANA